MNRNFLEEAITSFDKALEIKPKDANIWYNRGKALQELGQLEEAVANFDRAIQIKPDQLDSWYSRGKVLEKLGRIEEALTCFDKALEIKSNDPDIWCDRGKASQQLGRWEDALTSFDKTLGLRSNDTQARKYLRDLLPSEKDIDYTKLLVLLVAGKWRSADEETAAMMCKAANREKEGWLRVEDLDSLPCKDLQTIDLLWTKYSEGHFGFSSQKQICLEVGGHADRATARKLGTRIGWLTITYEGDKWKSYSDLRFSHINCVKSVKPAVESPLVAGTLVPTLGCTHGGILGTLAGSGSLGAGIGLGVVGVGAAIGSFISFNTDSPKGHLPALWCYKKNQMFGSLIFYSLDSEQTIKVFFLSRRIESCGL